MNLNKQKWMTFSLIIMMLQSCSKDDNAFDCGVPQGVTCQSIETVNQAIIDDALKKTMSMATVENCHVR